MLHGAERIAEAIEKARREGRAALLTIVPLIHEDPQDIKRLVNAIVEAGADMIEFQVSWPMSPVQMAQLAEWATADVDVPVLIWCQFDVIRSHQFVEGRPVKMLPAIAEHGIDGVASPVPLQFMDAWVEVCGDRVAPCMFVAPQMPAEDFEASCRNSRGFVYLIGVHASPTADAEEAVAFAEAVAMVRQFTDLPVIAGAGIETAQQAALAGSVCDGIATAKAMWGAVEEAEEAGVDPIPIVAAKVREFRQALEQSRV